MLKTRAVIWLLQDISADLQCMVLPTLASSQRGWTRVLQQHSCSDGAAEDEQSQPSVPLGHPSLQ